MSLMSTLAKVAIGYAAARGVDHFSGGKGLGALMGGAQVEGDDPLAKMQGQMGQMMGGGAAGNPMAGIMEQFQKSGIDLSALMGGGAGSSSSSGDKGGLLSSLGDGQGAGLAGLFAAMGGMASSGNSAMGGLMEQMGGLMEQMSQLGGATQSEETAGLMLRAMIQAAKCDGDIDEAERQKLLETIGEDADAEDIAFVQAQLSAPVDPQALADDTPQHLRPQVYSASLMTIRLDTQAEAKYLDALARAMGLEQPVVNTLHMQMGMQPLYS